MYLCFLAVYIYIHLLITFAIYLEFIRFFFGLIYLMNLIEILKSYFVVKFKHQTLCSHLQASCISSRLFLLIEYFFLVFNFLFLQISVTLKFYYAS